MTDIYALHGFLGRPGDWQQSLPKANNINLFQPPIKSLAEWAEQFNARVSGESVLAGYSLGGRLALHALIQNPKRWKAAVIISANPGLKEKREREERLAQDKKWAKRFLNDPWEKLMRDWNGQGVFAGDRSVMRNEADYDRAILCQVLEKWSVGHQEYLTPLIAALPMPLFWITGERDPKATCGLAFTNKKSREWRVPEAGHRLLWENELQEQLKQFIGDVQ